MKRGGLGVAGALGFSAVALGAFGAHGLRGRLTPPLLEIYRTGALYHLIHAVAALVHHYVFRDRTLTRMLPGSA